VSEKLLNYMQYTYDKVSDNLKEKIFFDNIYNEISKKGNRIEILQNLIYNLNGEVSSKGSSSKIQVQNLEFFNARQTQNEQVLFQSHLFKNNQKRGVSGPGGHFRPQTSLQFCE